jgi:hypothetical protein
MSAAGFEPNDLSLVRRLIRERYMALVGGASDWSSVWWPDKRLALGLSGAERAELALIDEQLLSHHRRQIVGERVQLSEMIVGAGPSAGGSGIGGAME